MAKGRRPAAERSSRAPGQPATRGAPRAWLFALVLVAAGIAAYSNSFTGAFMADDLEAIVDNPRIRGPLPLSPLVAPSDTTLAGRPVAGLTFGINYWIAPARVRDVLAPPPAGVRDERFLANVWGYHAVNLAIHLVAGLALMGVVRRTLLAPPLAARFGPAAAPLAFVVALLWLLHPLQTGSVTYIVQRVESLMGLFYLLTLYCAIRASEADFRSRWWTLAAIVCCALGMGTKEVMVSAPLFVALWIWICRPDVKLWESPRALLLGLAATWTVLAILVAGGPRSQSVGFGFEGWPWWVYLFTQAGILLRYLRLAIWPEPLVMFYDWLPASSWQEVVPGFVVLGTLGIGTLVALWRRRPVALLGAWFFLILGPTSSVLPIVTEVAAEHRMYLPLAAVVCLAVLGAYAGWTRRIAAGTPRPRWVRPAAWTTVVLAATLLGWRTYDRNRDYESFAVMARDIMRGRPENAVARLFVAEQLVKERRGAEAEAMLRTALTMPLPPGAAEHQHPLMRLYLGLALALQIRYDEAIAELERATAMKPSLAEAYVPLAETYQAMGRLPEAIAALDRGLENTTDRADLLSRSAWLRSTLSDASLRDGARAVRQAERAVALTSGRDPMALSALAAAYAETGQFDRARETVTRAAAAASSQGNTGLAQMLRAHQAIYEQGRAMRVQ